jgi:hypothetical protein
VADMREWAHVSKGFGLGVQIYELAAEAV